MYCIRNLSTNENLIMEASSSAVRMRTAHAQARLSESTFMGRTHDQTVAVESQYEGVDIGSEKWRALEQTRIARLALHYETERTPNRKNLIAVENEGFVPPSCSDKETREKHRKSDLAKAKNISSARDIFLG